MAFCPDDTLIYNGHFMCGLFCAVWAVFGRHVLSAAGSVPCTVARRHSARSICPVCDEMVRENSLFKKDLELLTREENDVGG